MRDMGSDIDYDVTNEVWNVNQWGSVITIVVHKLEEDKNEASGELLRVRMLEKKEVSMTLLGVVFGLEKEGRWERYYKLWSKKDGLGRQGRWQPWKEKWVDGN